MERLNLKKLGVLGGMGPLATAHFFRRIVECTEAKTDQEHLDIAILNHAGIPDRTKTILSGNPEPYLSLITADAKELERLGAAHIAIPCNTSHYFYKEIQASVRVPVINMVRESLEYAAHRRKAKKIGLLATDGTIKSEIYHRPAAEMGLTVVNPDPEGQEKVMRIIYDHVKSGNPGGREELLEVIGELKETGAETVILGCTELSCLNYDLPEEVVDALEVLVKRSIELSGGKYRGTLKS
ncbi:MAG: amino acid racemase [Patescibacteria group bacterium]